MDINIRAFVEKMVNLKEAPYAVGIKEYQRKLKNALVKHAVPKLRNKV